MEERTYKYFWTDDPDLSALLQSTEYKIAVGRAEWCLSDAANPCVASKLAGCQDLGAAQMLAQYTVDCIGDANALRPETKTLQRCGRRCCLHNS